MNTTLIDAIARATSVRDREEFDCATAELVFNYLHPQVVRIYRLVGEEGDRRMRLTALADESGVHVQPPQDFDSLAQVSEHKHWAECALLGDVVHFVPQTADTPAERRCAGSRLDTVFPVEGERGVVGIIEVGFSCRRPAIRPAEAQVVKAALGILRNHLEALDYGERDTLTGLLNRRCFDSTFVKRRAALSAPRAGKPRRTWLAVADIDRFKSINDTYGHLFGDEVLLLVARKITSTFRASEHIFRFGGEEFVVLLDSPDAAGAAAAFERMRANIAGHPFPQVGTVTVSIGFTEIGAGDIPASTIERADAALYYGKHNGRNQANCYEDLVREGKVEERSLGDNSTVEIF